MSSRREHRSIYFITERQSICLCILAIFRYVTPHWFLIPFLVLMYFWHNSLNKIFIFTNVLYFSLTFKIISSLDDKWNTKNVVLFSEIAPFPPHLPHRCHRNLRIGGPHASTVNYFLPIFSKAKSNLLWLYETATEKIFKKHFYFRWIHNFFIYESCHAFVCK